MSANHLKLDSKDKALLTLLQRNFPVTERPYAILGEQLGLRPDDVLARVKRLVDHGVIRKIRGLTDRRQLGINAQTLVGMNVPPDRVDDVMKTVSGFKGVTHNYVRPADVYNLWYAIEGKDEAFLKQTNEEIKRATGITDTLDLPTIRRFKVNLQFDFSKI